MKKFVFLALIVLIVNVEKVQSQSDTIAHFKHEISIVIDDVFAKQNYVVYPFYEPYWSMYPSPPAIIPLNTNVPKIGFAYKYHFPKSAIRSKVSFGSKSNTRNNVNDTSTTESYYSTSLISLGYEWNKTHGKVQFFYGIDVTIRSSNYSFENKSTNDGVDYSSETEQNFNALGLSPLLGVEYFVTPKLSISTEIKYILEAYVASETNKYSGSRSETKYEESGSNNYFGPVGQISINYNF